jgi:two-component system OmpR family response regulator
MRVLVIEDDPDGGSLLALGLAELGHDAVCARNCAKGLALAGSTNFDVLIVDRLLPDGDGIGIVTALRARRVSTPAVFVTGMNAVADRIAGLRAGADDYISKPFSFDELMARLEAVLRRREPTPDSILRVGDLEMDLIARTVRRSGEEIGLMPREFSLLELLMRHAGQTVTRAMLLEGVWKFHCDPETKILDVQISRLRQKIERCGETPLIHTVRGAGYCIREDTQ